jgi:hypothetical protein
MQVHTHYFVSRLHAQRYYANQGYTPSDVQECIKTGLIEIKPIAPTTYAAFDIKRTFLNADGRWVVEV